MLFVSAVEPLHGIILFIYQHVIYAGIDWLYATLNKVRQRVPKAWFALCVDAKHTFTRQVSDEHRNPWGIAAYWYVSLHIPSMASYIRNITPVFPKELSWGVLNSLLHFASNRERLCYHKTVGCYWGIPNNKTQALHLGVKPSTACWAVAFVIKCQWSKYNDKWEHYNNIIV